MHVRFIFSEKFEYTSLESTASTQQGIQNTSIQNREHKEESLSVDREHGQQQEEEHTLRNALLLKMLNVT